MSKLISMGKSKKPFTLLCLFDYNATTGFATVSQNIVSAMHAHFGKEIYMNIIAVNYFGETYKTNNDRTTVYPASKIGGKPDDFGRFEFLRILQENDIDGIFIVNDPGVILPMVPLLKDIQEKKRKANRKKFKSIYYFPVDGPVIASDFDGIEFFDLIVAYTEYAREELYNCKPSLKGKVKVILHGVNLSDFQRLDENERNEFRAAYFGKHWNKYIIGNVNRNQPRKDIPSTIFAFLEYRKKNKHTFLYLHMNPEDVYGWKLRPLMKQLGLVEGEDFMFPHQDLIDNHPPPDYLCCIYNALDLFVTTTTGEGFGLTIIEAMACGVPVIAPLHTSITELAGSSDYGNMYVADDLRLYANHFDNRVRYQCNPEQVAELMELAYEQDRLTRHRKERAWEFAQSLSWDIINRQWIAEFKRLFQ